MGAPAKLFAAIRKLDAHLSQRQVDGINALYATIPANYTPQMAAYIGFATVWLETAGEMQPIHEKGGEQYFRQYDIRYNPVKAKVLGNTEPGDGSLFHGRGYPQLTGRKNYALAGLKLGIDLIGNPDLALDPEVSARILYRGSYEGWFTGRKITQYFRPGVKKDDPVGARAVINGKDRAAKIAANYHIILPGLL